MDNVAAYEMDKLAIKYGGDIKHGSQTAKAQGLRADASSAKVAGRYGVGTTLLSGASKIGSIYGEYEG